ncbi:hypothetical protein LSCM1_07106 [Leishmania martiniquensis]|uniref:Uncharacterized protein n=1 Tax=Leishmania martiniquensis TaxID=1580590 RepID=A0A836H169_9TRYP|nr:hypothetical protein LSCM1_07106 [Leishmania martiniquensis]
MLHRRAHHSARDPTSATLAQSSAAVTPSTLSEDVASLLKWGRHLLQEQRQQRRTPSATRACADPPLVASRSPLLLASAAQAPASTAPGGDEHPRRMPAQSAMAAAMDPVAFAAFDASVTLEQARQRLAQLEEVEASNARVFERRWALLSLGRERLLRLHREQHVVEAPSPRTRELQRLIVTVQAIVEGEASLKEALREILRSLEPLYRQHSSQDGDVSRPSPALDQSIGLVASDHAGHSLGSEEGGEAVEGAPDSLRQLADAVARRTRFVLDAHRAWQAARAEQQRAAVEQLQRRAESEQALRQQLEGLKAALAEETEEEARERNRLAEQRARCAAAERAAALQNASALRKQAVKEALQQLELLQQEARLQNAIARQELAASEARYHQEKTAYDMALNDRNAAEEALAAAQEAYRGAKRRREDAESDLEQVRQALKSASDKHNALRVQRAQAAADCAAMDEELHRKQRAHGSLLSGEKDAYSSALVTALSLGGTSAANGAAERCAMLQRALPRLEQHLKRSLEEAAFLERAEADLRGTLEREKSALGLLRRQKKALEAYLTPPDDGVGEGCGAVVREAGTASNL